MRMSNTQKTPANEKIPMDVRLKLWNRKRLYRARIRRLIRSDPKIRASVPRPETIQTLLFIEAQEGWGDFLYYLGLLKALSEKGVTIDVVSLPETCGRYMKIPFVRKVFSMGDETDIQQIGESDYDIAFDVTYVNAIHWDLRAPILALLRCHTMTIGDMVAYLMNLLILEVIAIGKIVMQSS